MKLLPRTTSFAGDKDAAAKIREETIKPGVAAGRVVTLDFAGVDLATQSFVHALIASVVRENPDALDLLRFKNCNESIQSIIEIVVEYSQDELE